MCPTDWEALRASCAASTSGCPQSWRSPSPVEVRPVAPRALRATAAGAPETSPAVADPTASLPALDVSQHTVPLEQVYFDTFDGGSVRLSEANEPLIARLRDAIPPIDAPRYETAAMGDWLDGADLVLGFVTEAGDAYAYPHKILNFHEIVNEEFDGIPVLISYCPLCRSGVVYDRRLEGRTLSFGNTSALYESDLVMFDRETNSYWWQVAGRAIVGALSRIAAHSSPLLHRDVGRVEAAAPGDARAVARYGVRAKLRARPVHPAWRVSGQRRRALSDQRQLSGRPPGTEPRPFWA